jgi:lantibiotic leader peptide-processing serine protease
MLLLRPMTAALGAVSLILSACQSDSVQPTAPESPSLQLAGSSTADAGGRYVVLFKREGTLPAGFAALIEAAGGQVESASAGSGIATVTGLTPEGAARLARSTAVSVVEPDQTIDYRLPVVDASAVEEAAPISIESQAQPNLALLFPRQWNLRAVHADQAWAAGVLGSSAVTVAILDAGIDYTYPDLVGRVDLGRSVSFVPSDDALVATLFPGRHVISDLHFHGTHVAATVASNALILAGVTSHVTLIGVKVTGASGSGSFSGILNGIIYAAEHGADVINMSLGTPLAKAEFPGLNALINRTISYASRKGVVIVVSAGNEATDLDHDGNSFEAFCSASNVICVSATGPTGAASVNGPYVNIDAPASYSNFGRSAISVAAPGGNQQPVWGPCSTTSLLLPVCQTGLFIVGASGTSAAAPHVSGLAALLVERYGRNPARIKSAIQQSADDLGQFGTDPWYGKGRINVVTALDL